jgi:site-specific recombinase XerD
LKRRNYTSHTRRNYLNRLQHYLIWLPVEVESATPDHIKAFIDLQLERRLNLQLERRLNPQTINGHLIAIRSFYRYLREEEQRDIDNPVIPGLSLRLPQPLPRFLQDSEVRAFFSVITKQRDLAIFMLMLRAGLRVKGQKTGWSICMRMWQTH